MNGEQLAHVLRSAAYIAQDGDILVLGSQSILGSLSKDELPDEAIGSIEVDVAFFDDADEGKADAVDGAIGEGSMFHESHGIYGQGVSVSTGVLPAGGRDRLVSYDRADASPGRGKCLDPHDLVVAELVAGREKDRIFAQALVDAGLIDCDVLRHRASTLETVEGVRRRVTEAVTGIDRNRQPRT